MNSLFFGEPSSLAEREGDLVERLKARDPQAMVDLYDIYGKIIYTMILRIVHDHGCAEDLLQECFLRVWNRVSQLNSERGEIGPWLVVIARNCALDYRKSTQGRLAGNSTSSPFDFPPIMIEGDVISAERARLLHNAFLRLNSSQQEVIQLGYFEGLSQAEISARMNEPLGTIKSRMRSALQKLRQELSTLRLAC